MIDDFDLQLGQNLKAARERRGWSVQLVADKMDFCKDTVYKYEAGQREMKAKQIVKAAHILNASYETLLAGLKPDGSDQELAGKEFNVLSPAVSVALARLATEWDGNIEALMIFACMIAAFPEYERRELYMQGNILKDRLLSEGVIKEADLPPGISYMESELGRLYIK